MRCLPRIYKLGGSKAGVNFVKNKVFVTLNFFIFFSNDQKWASWGVVVILGSMWAHALTKVVANLNEFDADSCLRSGGP